MAIKKTKKNREPEKATDNKTAPAKRGRKGKNVGNIRGSKGGNGRWVATEVERLVMHETHYFYLGQAESGAELQSIFCLSSSAALIAHPLPRSAPFYPRSTQFRSF